MNQAGCRFPCPQCPHPDSNWDSSLRTRILYPLSYEGVSCSWRESNSHSILRRDVPYPLGYKSNLVDLLGIEPRSESHQIRCLRAYPVSLASTVLLLWVLPAAPSLPHHRASLRWLPLSCRGETANSLKLRFNPPPTEILLLGSQRTPSTTQLRGVEARTNYRSRLVCIGWD